MKKSKKTGMGNGRVLGAGSQRYFSEGLGRRNTKRVRGA
jgi:hypothetical protein